MAKSQAKAKKSSKGKSPAAAAWNPLASFHKSLPHDDYGEVKASSFAELTAAAGMRRPNVNAQAFEGINRGSEPALNRPPNQVSAQLVNPLAGLARDPLVPEPHTFTMPEPPPLNSRGIAAELTELYWMALLRDLPFDQFTPDHAELSVAATELESGYGGAVNEGTLDRAMDLPQGAIAPENIFRMGLPGEETGPLVSQFFIRDVRFGTQTIDQTQSPYRRGLDFLTTFPEWRTAQHLGRGADGEDYTRSNEKFPSVYLEEPKRHISCMRDLARFVNKDALHQAYFSAALQLLDGRAKWTPGNRYHDQTLRDAGFGTLGGPHILALVSEVATRALQTVWFQKWQVFLRLRPEAFAGRLHVQEVGVQGLNPPKKAYGLKLPGIEARRRIMERNDGGLLLPMAFTAGSPVHPAYGAGHATVAGACVTVLKAFFELLDEHDQPLPIGRLENFPTFVTGINAEGEGVRTWIDPGAMTIEGELNKLASNVALGRSMGGVHWRTDNTRSLVLGEAMSAHVLGRIATDLVEQPRFKFRTFGRQAGKPRLVEIIGGAGGDIKKTRVSIDNTLYKLTADDGKSLSSLLDPPNEFKA